MSSLRSRQNRLASFALPLVHLPSSKMATTGIEKIATTKKLKLVRSSFGTIARKLFRRSFRNKIAVNFHHFSRLRPRSPRPNYAFSLALPYSQATAWSQPL